MSEFFNNKTILLISPEKWGGMHISKHHYAIELTGYCKKVFFLNPAVPNLKTAFLIEQHKEYENLFIVSCRSFFSQKLRFKFRFLFDVLMKFQVKKLLKSINEPIDVVWCFNRYTYANLNWFNAETRIYHPVDQVSSYQQVEVGNTATIILTVSDLILEKFIDIDVPKYIINHGLSHYFSEFCDANETKQFDNSRKLKVGYIGNLLKPSLDRASFKQIVENNQQVEFHMWGPTEVSNSNLGGDDSRESQDFINFLKDAQNVILEGVKSPKELAASIQNIDAFLLCFDMEKNPNRGSNSHKIMEYLSTGKVIISQVVSMYKDDGDLIAMTDKQTSIVELFGEVISNLEFYNREEIQMRRKEFAMNNTYKKQIQRIAKILSLELNL